MTSVLDSIEWGKPALSLIEHIKKLDPTLPATLHIRHTERPQATPEGLKQAMKAGHSQLLSSERGKQAAYELGKQLPKGREYRVYHTSVKRTQETAENIHKGILAQNLNSKLEGVFFKGPNDDYPKRLRYMRRDTPELDKSIRQFFIHRVSGRYPPWELEDSMLIAKKQAAKMVENLRTAQMNTLDVCVSHDVVIATFMLHWFGIMVDERFIEFLDGFIVQLYEETMVVYTKDERREVYYPYWWNF